MTSGSQELNYLLSLKESAFLKLKDVLQSNSDIHSIKVAKDTCDLINYQIDTIRSRLGLINTPHMNVSIAADSLSENPYSDFVSFRESPCTIETPKRYGSIKECNNLQQAIQQTQFLKPKSTYLDVNPIKINSTPDNFSIETFPITHGNVDSSEQFTNSSNYDAYSNY